MNATLERDPIFINPNWSAFVLLVTLLAAFNSLVFLLLPISDDAGRLLRYINVAISLILWADFIYLLRQSPDKRHFMVAEHGWMVLLGSFPFFRVLRVLWFRLILKANGRTLRQFLSRIVIKQSAEGTLLLILFTVIIVFEVAVVSILSFEEVSPEGNITSISDALWWAFATITTVGYGDNYPVTNGGRFIAIMLMAVGIALFSVITGSLAEWFRSHQQVRRFQLGTGEETGIPNTIAEMRHLLEQQEEAYQQSLDELKTRLSVLETELQQRN